jgi:hypothetical protein
MIRSVYHPTIFDALEACCRRRCPLSGDGRSACAGRRARPKRTGAGSIPDSARSAAVSTGARRRWRGVPDGSGRSCRSSGPRLLWERMTLSSAASRRSRSCRALRHAIRCSTARIRTCCSLGRSIHRGGSARSRSLIALSHPSCQRQQRFTSRRCVRISQCYRGTVDGISNRITGA